MADLRHSCGEAHLPPQLLEPCRVGGGVTHGVLNIAVPEIVLNETCVRALIGESKAAGMAQHVGMNGNGEASTSPRICGAAG